MLFSAGGLLFVRPTYAALPTDQGEMTGVVEDVRFAPVDEEPRAELAEFDVRDGRGKKMTFVINRDTSIRDPQWRSAYVSYVGEGNRVKVHYVVSKEGVNTARSVQVIEE